MASGSCGLCGRAVLKPAEGGASRETGFVTVPFLEGSLVLEMERRSGTVMKRDVQVCAWKQRLSYQQNYIRDRKLSNQRSLTVIVKCVHTMKLNYTSL